MPEAIRRRGDTVTHVGKSTPAPRPARVHRELGKSMTGPCHVQMFASDRVTGETRCVWRGDYSHTDAATSSDSYILIGRQTRDGSMNRVKVAPVGPTGKPIMVGHSGWIDCPSLVIGVRPSDLPSDVLTALNAWLGKRKHAACRLLDVASLDHDTLSVKADTGKVTAGEAAAVSRSDHKAGMAAAMGERRPVRG